MTPGLHHYLIVSALLFSLGLLGVVARRNLFVIFMGLELMLNAANLALVAFSRYHNNLNGQVMVFFIITVAAAEVAVGLALLVALYRVSHILPLTLPLSVSLDPILARTVLDCLDPLDRLALRFALGIEARRDCADRPARQRQHCEDHRPAAPALLAHVVD